MTKKKAISILIDVAVCHRPILSCDYCSQYQGVAVTCNQPSDRDIKEAVITLLKERGDGK